MPAESIWISPTKKNPSAFKEFVLFAKELLNRVTV